MSAISTSESLPGLFPDIDATAPSPAPRVRSARSVRRGAAWEQEVNRTAYYLMSQARTEDERAAVETLYDQALEEGPDFIHYVGPVGPKL